MAGAIRSNRTFMELKLVKKLKKHFLSMSSNRTFMELKFEMSESVQTKQYVLIVPLWN